VGRVQPAPYVAGDAASGPHWVALVDRMVENVTSLQPPGLWADPRYQDFVEVEVGCAAWDSIDVIEGHPAHSLLTNRQPTAGFFCLAHFTFPAIVPQAVDEAGSDCRLRRLCMLLRVYLLLEFPTFGSLEFTMLKEPQASCSS
jgi:hypothetical protein